MATILCVSSFFKGNRFIETCNREGARTILLTVEKLLGEPWSRDALSDVWALPDFEDLDAVIRAVAWLMRDQTIDRIAPLDDFDVELVAALREHFRIPGMGSTTARYFRDKLAMRERASARGVRNPEFVRVVCNEEIREFAERVPPPWMLKPRSEASATGIRKIRSGDELWTEVELLGDRRSWFVLEQMIPGDVFHIDTLAWNGAIVFSQASRYRRPLFEVAHEGGIFASTTLVTESEEARALLECTRQLGEAFKFVRGVMHTEFIRSTEDGEYYFLETAARVGGAHIAEMVEAASGVNLWEEWARIEISQGESPYSPPVRTSDASGLIVSLSRQEFPDTTEYIDPEIWMRLSEKKNHVGFVLKSNDPERVHALIEEYVPRIQRDFHAALPAPDRPTS